MASAALIKQVEQRLLDLGRVDLDGQDLVGEVGVDAILPAGQAEGLGDLEDQRVEIDHPDIDAARSGIAEELGREFGSPVDERLDGRESSWRAGCRRVFPHAGARCCPGSPSGGC